MFVSVIKAFLFVIDRVNRVVFQLQPVCVEPWFRKGVVKDSRWYFSLKLTNKML